MAKKPITHEDLNALPDGALLTLLDICSRGEHRGVLPFSKSKLWELIADDMVPRGRPKPADNRPYPATVWPVAQVKAMVAAYQEGTLGTVPVEALETAT